MVVDNRQDHETKKALGNPNDSTVLLLNFLSHDSSGNVFNFTQIRMADVAKDNDLPE